MRWAWLALAGCGVTPERFVVDLGAVSCAQEVACFGASALGAACEEASARVNGPVGDCKLEACAYDAGAAAECLNDLEAASCEEFFGGGVVGRCADVYVDCDDVALAACVAAAGF